MSTQLKHPQINEEYLDLFAFKSKNEEIEHNAQMISYRILSEVEKACDEKNINKKELAAMVGSSASYITQLFRGAKHVNMDMMARFEEVLEFGFEIKVKHNAESHSDFVFNQVNNLGIKRYQHKQNMWHCFTKQSGTGASEHSAAILDMKPNHLNKQKAS